MMWRAHNFNIPQTLDSWSDSELEDWRASFLKQSEVIPMSPPPDLSVIASDMPPITEPHSYNYRLHLPPAPVAFGARLSPALSSTSSAYLDPGAVNGYINESSQGPTSTGFDTIISSTNLYDPRCPSPWTDVTSSPAPSSNYPNPSTIKKSIDGNIPRSTSIQENGAAPTPASLHDASFSSPWTDVTPSSVPTGETTCTTVSSKRPSQAKLPCRSRRLASKKNENKDYGTYKCEYKDCTYDRMFSRKGVLKRHIQTQHINPRGFKCPLCEHASSRRENMKAHRQSVHKEIF